MLQNEVSLLEVLQRVAGDVNADNFFSRLSFSIH